MSTQFPQSIETQSVKDYLISIINPLNVLNTDTGTNLVEINASTGVAIFTSAINPGTSSDFTVTNSFITTDTYLDASISYKAGVGNPELSFYECQSGAIVFRVNNIDTSDATDNNITITFRIIG